MTTEDSGPWTPGTVLRVARDFKGADDITGVFIAASEEWLLMERVEHEVMLNGFVALPREDVDLVVDLTGQFMGRALAALDQYPTHPGPVDLTDVRTLITTAGSLYPLVVVHTEYDDPDVCWIGQVRSCGAHSVELRAISPQAKWDDEDTEYDFEEISLVEFGTRYDKALRILGGPPPP